jgi:hypothetical protein
MHDLQNHQDALFSKDVSVYGSMMRPTLIDYLTRQLYHVVLGK